MNFRKLKEQMAETLRGFTCKRVYQNTTGSQDQIRGFRLAGMEKAWVVVEEREEPPA
jgi:hypothetical protein